MIIEHVHANGRTLLDGDAQREIGNPDKDVTGKFFSPDRSAGALDELSDDVAVDDLPGDEQGDGQQADDQKTLLEIFVEPVQRALMGSVGVFHTRFLWCTRKGKSGPRMSRGPEIKGLTSGCRRSAGAVRRGFPWRTGHARAGSWRRVPDAVRGSAS